MTQTVPVAGTDPAADIRDEIAAASGVPELPGKIWFHRTAASVIDAGRCVACGGCLAACPSRSLSLDEHGQPTLTRMCTGCSACWDFCPLAGLRTERLHPPGLDARASIVDDVGSVLAAYSARCPTPADGAQDGGVVTGLLAALLEQRVVDGVVLTRRLDAFHGEPFLATTSEQVRSAAGSVYHQAYPLQVLTRPLPAGVRTLALVGTPCQLSVLSALRRYPWPHRDTAADAVVLTVGLFCTRSFDPLALQRALLAAQVDLRQVHSLDIRDARLAVRDPHGDELFTTPVRQLRGATLPGCAECADFTARAADVAVGNVGSQTGHSTVLIRTQAGLSAWHAAGAALSSNPIEDLTPVTRLARRNRRDATRISPRRLDPDGPLWITRPEHLAAYQASARAAAVPPASRSHHYDIGC